MSKNNPNIVVNHPVLGKVGMYSKINDVSKLHFNQSRLFKTQHFIGCSSPDGVETLIDFITKNDIPEIEISVRTTKYSSTRTPLTPREELETAKQIIKCYRLPFKRPGADTIYYYDPSDNQVFFVAEDVMKIGEESRPVEVGSSIVISLDSVCTVTDTGSNYLSLDMGLHTVQCVGITVMSIWDNYGDLIDVPCIFGQIKHYLGNKIPVCITIDNNLKVQFVPLTNNCIGEWQNATIIGLTSASIESIGGQDHD